MLKKAYKHFLTVTKHKYYVFRLSIKAGIPVRGFLHDFSKYSFTEFWESAKYYTDGKSSPITNCKRERGYSKAWLHHKGRNKHHHEYWYDYETTDEVPVIPYKYTVEMICDQLAAGITYNGKNWRKDTQLKYWRNVENRRKINPRIANMLDEVYVQVSKQGIDKVINKKNLKELYKNCEKDALSMNIDMKELEKNLDECKDSLKSDILYLYFTQLGRCMYTLEPIDISELKDNKKYDIDHIYPQAIIKDDSLSNRVLVDKTKNNKKSDIFLYESDV